MQNSIFSSIMGDKYVLNKKFCYTYRIWLAEFIQMRWQNLVEKDGKKIKKIIFEPHRCCHSKFFQNQMLYTQHFSIINPTAFRDTHWADCPITQWNLTFYCIFIGGNYTARYFLNLHFINHISKFKLQLRFNIVVNKYITN